MLDELFPSLGNGESSGSHLTNQLAILLQNLGSSDDESSNGPNLYNPLQLSPPRLNEIHALATANLISQTQEAIMQEYNITDFDFDKCTYSNNQKNPESSSNVDETHDLGGNILGNVSHDINSIPCSELDTFSDKTRQGCEISNHTSSIVYNDDANYTTLLNVKIPKENIDLSLTKVKSMSCETKDSSESEKTEVFKQVSEPCFKSTNISDQELETRSAVQNILDTPCSLQKDSVMNSLSTNEELNTRISRPGYIGIKKCPQDHLLGNTLGDSESFSNKLAEQTQQSTDLKRKHDLIDYMLPPKKRHVECNTASMTLNGSQSQDENRNIHYNNTSQIETNTRSDTYIHGNRNICKENEKEKPILYVCVMCMKQFSNVDKLEQHSTNHQHYSCPAPDCVRTFTYRSHLSYHKQTHEGQKNHQCSECGKVFSKAQHLDRHVMTHKEIKPFTCSVCNKSFTTAGNLKNHSRTHSGERPYACDVKDCTKTFAELSSLKKHKVIHTGEKSFRCDLCGKSFTQASSRNYHMKKHKEKT
ncbi:zinc finger protein 37-like [Ruditapes philippinarum]|uniref:zinc finger protein 37-like n=1 Tax=Ruditapes philippinarum TaxID=129788 RepID=UPI00295A6FF3|nr:zinc finger protein 37-like [Ruditapes philippinarum]